MDSDGLARLRRRGPNGEELPGLVMVGSHVPLADRQLMRLLADPGCIGLELPVRRIARVLDGGTPDLLLPDMEREWREHLQALLQSGRTPVLFTSRGEIRLASASAGMLVVSNHRASDGASRQGLGTGIGLPD